MGGSVANVSFCFICLYCSTLFELLYIEDITRWREDMKFIFEWQNNVFATRK